MNPERAKLLAATLAVVGMLIAAGFFAAPKPRLYRGKTVLQWVALLDMNVDRQKEREEASWVLAQVGVDALPELRRILAWRPSRLELFRGYAVRFHLLKPRPIPPLELQSRACEAAYHVAEDGHVDISSLVPDLRYHFTNGTYADSNSGRALARAGPSGFSVLTNCLFTGTPALQDMAGWSLGFVRRRPEVIAALVQYASSDASLSTRCNGLIYLRGCNGPAELIIPLGLKYLNSQSRFARDAAAELLAPYRQDEEVRKALEQYQHKSPSPAPAGDWKAGK